MHDETVTILENRKINEVYWRMAFSSKRLSRGVKPGQFLNVKIDDGPDPFLRRPFSYYRVRGNQIQMLYACLGRGTQILSRKKPGTTLQALGPLGKPFAPSVTGKKQILVGGGVGVPPLVFLAESSVKIGMRLLIGCKSKSEVMPRRELAQVRAEVRYATDDGSYGRKGFVTALLEEILKSEDPRSLYVQTCGPTPMMRAVLDLARKYGAAGEASVEERMACGVGACLGCVVETKTGYETSCVRGPVFSFDELVHL